MVSVTLLFRLKTTFLEKITKLYHKAADLAFRLTFTISIWKFTGL